MPDERDIDRSSEASKPVHKLWWLKLRRIRRFGGDEFRLVTRSKQHQPECADWVLELAGVASIRCTSTKERLTCEAWF
ncbi:MAG: hypothetical protein JO132_13540 [Streptosporangiaceae bacterium]|nr:hypothetical protein [Streptosporangiaceae bacterium]